jgi:hypothetical protein
MVLPLLVEYLMDECDRNRSLPDRGRDTLDVSSPDVANCEHAC